MADFDGDGENDLYTGCYEGGIYWLRGLGKGEFAAPEQVLDDQGAVLRLGMFWNYETKKWDEVASSEFKDELGIAAAAVDWDADGDLDLILGSQDGHLFLRRNQGSPQKAAFAAKSEQLLSGKKPLRVDGRHAMPVAADWDGDGKWDLLSGSGQGGVVWFRNAGEKAAPEFAQCERLVPASKGDADGPGQRTQVNVADFDGDGHVDLLVGDYRGKKVDDGKYDWHGYVWVYRRTRSSERGVR